MSEFDEKNMHMLETAVNFNDGIAMSSIFPLRNLVLKDLCHSKKCEGNEHVIILST